MAKMMGPTKLIQWNAIQSRVLAAEVIDLNRVIAGEQTVETKRYRQNLDRIRISWHYFRDSIGYLLLYGYIYYYMKVRVCFHNYLCMYMPNFRLKSRACKIIQQTYLPQLTAPKFVRKVRALLNATTWALINMHFTFGPKQRSQVEWLTPNKINTLRIWKCIPNKMRNMHITE